MNRPNFLIICTDQMRADHMGCAGNPVIRTPNLDALAAAGTHLPRAYVNCPLCMPSRATLYTGRTPRGHGVRTNGIPLDRDTPTVATALAEAGYRTGAIGKIHLTNFMIPKDGDPAFFSPERFPEFWGFWNQGAIRTMPTPYFGLQHMEITLGHASGVRGDYLNWVEAQDPALIEKLKNGPVKHSPIGAEGCAAYPLPEEYHHTTYVASRTIEYLRRHDRSQPFYLWCSFPDPHHAYHVPEPWDRMYSRDEVVPPVSRPGELDDLAPFFKIIYESKLPLSGRSGPTRMSDEKRREIIAYTYGSVSLIDKHVGRVLAALDELKLSQDTVVLFISDHGDMMGDHGLLNKGPFHFEGLLRVPMIWRWPGHFPARKGVDALASLLDVPPTILDLAGVPIPEGPSGHEAPLEPPAWPGRSLAPLLTGAKTTVQDSVVIENDEDYLGLRLRTLVTATHKITTYTGPRGPEPYGELFDLQHDPNELQNLWSRPEDAGLRSRLIEQLHYRLVETDIAMPRRLTHA